MKTVYAGAGKDALRGLSKVSARHCHVVFTSNASEEANAYGTSRAIIRFRMLCCCSFGCFLTSLLHSVLSFSDSVSLILTRAAFALFESKNKLRPKSKFLIKRAIEYDRNLESILKWKMFEDVDKQHVIS